MGHRLKVYGFTEPDGYVRLFWPVSGYEPHGLECEAILRPGILPEGLAEGTPFTLHYRGAKLLYAYVIDKPVWTRSAAKRSRIEARKMMKLWERLDDQTNSYSA